MLLPNSGHEEAESSTLLLMPEGLQYSLMTAEVRVCQEQPLATATSPLCLFVVSSWKPELMTKQQPYFWLSWPGLACIRF